MIVSNFLLYPIRRKFYSLNTALTASMSRAMDDLDVTSFKKALNTFERPLEIDFNGKPFLMELCGRLVKSYPHDSKAWNSYRIMLNCVRDDINPDDYGKYYESDTMLTLLAKINEPSIAWYLNSVLAINKTINCIAAKGINGTDDINAAHYLKDVPLFHAVDANSFHTAKTFLNHGANPNIRDPKKKTPLDYALKNGSKEIIKLLEDAGAVPGRTLSFSARFIHS
jgi:hypothetical protein